MGRRKLLASAGLLCLVVSLLVVVSGGAVLAQSTSMSVSPASQEVDAGETFDVEIMIDTDVATRGAQCAVSFDPDVVQCNGYTAGGFYSDWAAAHGGSTMVFPEPVIDNVGGSISDIGIAIMGGDPGGPTGSGAFVIYHFTAVADGVSRIELENVKVVDVQSLGIPDVVVNDGEVLVGEVPPHVSTLDASDVGGSSAVLNGYLEHLGTASTVLVSFEWDVSADSLAGTTPEEMSEPGPFSAVLVGLGPETSYLYRAVAEGDGVAYGDQVYFTTVLPGDANDDGSITMQDVTYTELIILGYLEPTSGADANEDGNINMGDVTTIELMILGYV